MDAKHSRNKYMKYFVNENNHDWQDEFKKCKAQIINNKCPE